MKNPNSIQTEIGSKTILLSRMVFWSIGYWLGFSVVSILSVGMLVPEEFKFIGRERNRLLPVFIQNSQVRLSAELVGLIGWLVIFAIVFWATA